MIQINTVLSVLAKIGFKAFSSLVNKAVWDGYFIYACEIVTEVDEKDASEIAKHAYKKSPVKVLPLIKEELTARQYDEAIVKKYLEVFIDNIKDNNPIIYLLFKIETIEDYLSAKKEANTIIEKQIKLLQSNPLYHLNYLSIDDYDDYLKQCSRDNGGSPCLDIFNFEDSWFTNDINKALFDKANPILICGEYQRETFLATLCELKKAFPNDYLEKVYIFSSPEDYLKAIDIELPSDAILINCFFNADSIPVVSKCINIHIVSKWKSKDSYIRLRPRIVSSVRNSLERNGFSSDFVSKIVRKRKNVFSFLFKELFNETDNYEARVVETINKKVIAISMLVNKFCLASKKDVQFIQTLSNFEIDDYVNMVTPAKLTETPFVKITDDYGYKQIVLLDFEESFRLFSDFITPSIANRFFDLVRQSLCILPTKYLNDNYIRTVDDPSHSDAFLNSILETLLFFTMSNRYKRQCLELIESFIDWVEKSDTIGHYKYLADYLGILMEICPSKINKKISHDISNSEGLWNLFVNRDKNGTLFSTEKYVEVLWTMEKLLFINEEREKAILSLFDLYCLNERYHLSNSPGNSLKTFFVAWIQTTPAKSDEKIKLCEKLFSRNASAAWDIFSDMLYTGGGETISPFNGPRYIQYDRFSQQLSRKEIADLYKYYNDLIIDKANTPKQIAKLIEKHSFIHFGNESIKSAIKRIKKVCKESNDEGKETIADSLREFIHNNRRFRDADWAIEEEILKQFENILKGINYSNPEMKYIHLFNSYHINEPHPIPFNHGNYDYHSDEVNKEKYLSDCCDQFIKNGLNIDFIYQYFNNPINSEGINYNFYLFSKKIEMVENKKTIQEYALTLVSKANNIKRIFSFLGRDLFDNDKIQYYAIANLLIGSTKDKLVPLEYLYSGCIDLTQKEYVDYYSLLPKSIKKLYWKHFRSHTSINYLDKETVCFVMENLKTIPAKQSTNNPYLEVLYSFSIRYKGNDAPEVILKFLTNIDLDYIKSGHFSYLPELLKILHDRYAFTDDITIETQIACLEMLVIKGDDGNKAICLKNVLARTPDLYFSFINNLYIDKATDKNYIGNLFYLLQFSLKFCPGYVNGTFNNDIFKKWVDKYKELIYASTFEKKDWLFYSTLGKLFKHALPEDGLPMPRTIIDYVEAIDKEERLKEVSDYYCMETTNTLGVRTISDGSDLIAHGRQYERQATELEQLGFNKTSKIFHSLAETFINDGNRERKRAEDEW